MTLFSHLARLLSPCGDSKEEPGGGLPTLHLTSKSHSAVGADFGTAQTAEVSSYRGRVTDPHNRVYGSLFSQEDATARPSIGSPA